VEPDPEEEQCKIIVCDLQGMDCIKLGNGVILVNCRSIE
jgi:hypothetical protein